MRCSRAKTSWVSPVGCGLRAAGMLLFASLLACASGAVPKIGERPRKLDDAAAEKAYQDTLARFTARGEIYDGLDTRLFVGATHQSEQFIDARVRRKGAFQAQPPVEIEAALAKELAEHAGAT